MLIITPENGHMWAMDNQSAILLEVVFVNV